MPILEIEIVLRPGEQLPSNLAIRLADAAASIFQSAQGSLWVKVREIDAAHYAENSGPHGPVVFPVFVSVLKADRVASRLPAEAAQLAVAVGELCGRPAENVHVIFEPEGRGRVAFGGKMIPSAD